MTTPEILSAIDAEIAKLQQARAILASMPSSNEQRGPGRPKASTSASASATKKRSMSAEAKARIAAAQKKRWAAQKSGK